MRTVEKPWGKEEIWGETDKYLGKFLYINAGEMLSRQYHEVKEETICVLEGRLCLEIGGPHDLGFKNVSWGRLDIPCKARNRPQIYRNHHQCKAGRSQFARD